MMNVTSNGYYTTQYLNQQQRRPRQYFQYVEKESYQTPRTPHENLQSLPAQKYNRNERKPIMRNIRPRREQPTNLNPFDPSKSLNATNSKQIMEVDVDPEDQLEEEPTPAELKQIHEDNIIVIPIEEPKQPQKDQKLRSSPRKNKNDDYYLKQKQRYDEAKEIKPKLYTHKTFREVFTDKQENQKKYNPIDTVFEQSDDLTGSSKTNAKLSAFLKSIKVIKDDYNNYNYYDHRKRKNVERDVFVSEESDDDEAEETMEQEESSEVDDTGNIPKKKKKQEFKTIWRKKLNRAKKKLGKDFDSHLNGNSEQDMSSEASLIEEILETDLKNDAMAQSGNEFAITSMVSLSFNYLWSWYDFYQNRDQTPGSNHNKAMVPLTKLSFTQSSAINDIPGQRSKGQIRTRFANGSKQLFTGWNQPANRMFKGESTGNKGRRMVYPTKNDTSSSIAPSSEFIVEYDSSDEDSMTQELYYNPQTKQLEAQPPTSSQSMIRTNNTKEDTSSLAIVSTLLNLIKRIHIMQLIYTPIDFVGEHFPQLQTLIIVLELVLFVWILYELSRLVDALCMMVRAFCSPMIAVGRFMNKIM